MIGLIGLSSIAAAIARARLSPPASE